MTGILHQDHSSWSLQMPATGIQLCKCLRLIGGHLIQMTIMWVLGTDPGSSGVWDGLFCSPGWLHEVLYIAEADLGFMSLLHLLPKCCDYLLCHGAWDSAWDVWGSHLSSEGRSVYSIHVSQTLSKVLTSPHNWEQRGWDAVWLVWGTDEKPCGGVSFWFCVKG